MGHDLLNIIRREVERVTSAKAVPRIGTVDGYDPDRYAARVLLLPEEKLTGWLPIAVEWMGNGWGLLAPVSPGDQVLVEFQEHDKDSGIITKRLFDTRNVAPAGCPSGELWLIHKSGSYFKLTNDGKMALNSGAEIDLGNLENAIQTICLKAFHDWAETHTHTGVQVGSDNTGPPTTPPPDNSLTTITKAN
jgi:uncharacterized protein involved in type VI secretion and phage assembly